MKTLVSAVSLIAALGVLLVFSGGCGQGKPREPLTPDRAISELPQAFAKAKPEMKEIAGRAVTALQAKNYTEASTLLMQLSSAPDLSAPERELVARARMGVSRLLLAAEATGDPQSAEYLRRVRRDR